MTETMTRAELNGMDPDALRTLVAKVNHDRTRADRDPIVTARWTGGDTSEVTFASGETPVRFVDGGPSAMKMLLATLVACDVDLVSTRATLLGVEIESLSVQATGHFNVARYLGVEPAVGPGYERIASRVILRTRNATPSQLDELQRACEDASPVSDTLRRGPRLSLEFEAG
jgi:uncharacterized OsmC-like protein